MREIENVMVLDSHWKERERTPKVFGECAGCEEDILAGEDYYEMASLNGKQIETVKVHQNDDCCRQFIAENSYSQTAGEE